MSEHTYRAAVIGLGFAGGGDPESGERIGQKVEDLDGHHREALTRNPRIELVAGCDLDPGRRERFAGRTGARPYGNWREMLDNERLDIVSIATTAPTHAELTVGCAERGMRVVYCEKPIASSLQEAERMVDACRRAGSLLVVNHNRRFNPAYRRLRTLIADGGLGDLTSVYLRWGSGRLGCVGTHLIDAARMLTGREVVGVSAQLDQSEAPDCRGPNFHDPGGWGLLGLQHGLTGLVNAGNQATGPAEVVVEGTRGRAVTGGRGVRLEWFDGRLEEWPVAEPKKTSMDRAVSEIVDWLQNPTEFSTPPAEALRTFEVIAGFHASQAQGGQWVNLPLAAEHRKLRIRCA